MAPAAKRLRISEDGDAVTTALADLRDEFHKLEQDDPDLNHSEVGQKLSRSLYVRSLPATATSQSLADHFSQNFPLKHVVVVVDRNTKISKGYGFVTFTDAEDAQRAKEQFDESFLEDKRLRVEIAKPRHREVEDEPAAASKKSRPPIANSEANADDRKKNQDIQSSSKLIIRNLPWSIRRSDELAQLFRSYGKVKQAVLPKKESGLSPGFGFVTLRGRKNAEKAIAGVNGKAVDGRTLAVDWAIEKVAWQQMQEKTASNQDTGADQESDRIDLVTGATDAASETSKSSQDDYADEDSEDGASRSEHTETQDDDDHASTDHSAADDPESGHAAAKEDYSCTLFIRNLPFTATDEALLDHFLQFGPLRYARIVMDPETDRPRGTGFVCFRNSKDAVQCLHRSPKTTMQPRETGKAAKHSILQDTQVDPLGHFTMEGRVLQISRAVDRDEAQRLTVQGQSARNSRERDKRHLYLLAEGTISPQSPLHATLAPSEMKMREDSAKQRQALVKSNPQLHISLTRLSVRNIPRHLTSKDLKALAREAVVGFAKDVKEGRRQHLSKEELSRGGDSVKEAERQRKMKKRGIVKQAHIVFEGRDGTKMSEKKGAGKSRGYGFIEYTSHRCALMGLRWLNGFQVGNQVERSTRGSSPTREISERKKRLIVEFAIENAQVVARRRNKEEKARKNPGTQLENHENNGGEKVKASPHDVTVSSPKKSRKRKRDANFHLSEQEQRAKRRDPPQSEKEEAEIKRNRIIARKRTLRRTRKPKN